MKILFVDSVEIALFSFRKELLDKLISDGHEVVLCTKKTKRVIDEYENKIKVIGVESKLKSKNIISNVKLLLRFKKIVKSERPDLIISYAIKPNIYLGLQAKNIPMIANITGLGNAFKKKGIISTISVLLYKISFKNVRYVFFQNQDGYNFFGEKNIKINNYKIIPGSGVNTSRYVPLHIKNDSGKIRFLFASRAIKEKGFELLMDAIPLVVKEQKNVVFNILSAEEDVYANKKALNVINNYGDYVKVLARSESMESVYNNNDFLVSPSYYREGISNILLESLACEKPIITTSDNPGCIEVLQDGINGYGVKSRDLNSLVDTLNKAAQTSQEDIDRMGKNGREFVKKNFERSIVIDEYLKTIEEIENNK